MPLFPTVHTDIPSEQGSGDSVKNRAKNNLQPDYNLINVQRRQSANNIEEPIQLVIGCSPFLSQLLLHSPTVDNGFTLATLARFVRRAAKNKFPLAFSDIAPLHHKVIEVAACQQFLVRFEFFLRTAAHFPSMVFIRNVFPVPESVNTRLRNVTFWKLRLQESRF